MAARNARSPRKPRAKGLVAAKAKAKASKLSARRIGTETSKTRAVLLDAAEQLMRDEGYAAVTSRRLAAKAGLKRQLVHYYFRTMDDLFLALWAQYADKIFAQQADALASAQPLRGLWDLSSDAWDTSLYIEFMALANHRKTIRAELAETGERYRKMQFAALSRILDAYGLRPALKHPEVLPLIITSIPRILVMEEQLGMSGGHRRTREFAERWIAQFEGVRKPPRKRQSRK